MNRLNKIQTSAWFKNAGDYDALCAYWSALVNDKEARKGLSAAHHLLYAALRGKDWRRGFCPITNPRKLENGAFFDMGARHAINRLHSKWHEDSLLTPFGGWVTGEMIQQIRELIPKLAWEEDPLAREAYSLQNHPGKGDCG